MDERVLRFRVGVVVIAAAIITIILITLLGAWPSPFTPRYTMHIVFPSAPGVAVDTPVRKSGIEIGRVSNLELREKGGVVVTLKINSQYPLRFNEVCRISTGSLVTGDAVLEFIPSDDRTLSNDIVPDDTYFTNGQIESNPLDTFTDMKDEIRLALESVRIAGMEISTLARRVNQLTGQDDLEFASLIDKTKTALDNFNKVMISIDSVMGDDEQKARLRQSLGELPAVFSKASGTLDEFQSTLKGFGAVAVRANRNMDNIEEGITEPLKTKGKHIVDNFDASMASVSTLLANAAELSEALRNNNGTIGQLINNPELYDRAIRTMAEVETLLRKFEPIINDIRVVTDKVARDPAQLGVKAIYDRRPPGAGQKYPVYPDSPSTAPTRLGDVQLGRPFK